MSDQKAGPEYPQYPGVSPTGSAEPGMPPPAPTAQPAPERPRTIATAVKLMWAGAALTVVSTMLGFATGGYSRSEAAKQARDLDPNATQSEIDLAYAFGMALGLFFAVVTLGLWMWMAWKNGQGRSWARVVATVLGGLGILSTLAGLAFASAMGMAGGTNASGFVVGGIQLILAVVILVLLWQKQSTAYYNAVSRRQVI